MTKARILILAVLIPFIIFTDIAVFSISSFSELWVALTNHLIVVQVIFDFLIVFTLSSIWVWHDARQRGVNPIFYLILMLTTGSIGLLVYLYIHVCKKPGKAAKPDVYHPAVQ